jgi:cytidine deaminase
MQTFELDDRDQELIAAAAEVIRRNFDGNRHSVGAAVLCDSGKTYAGVNVDSCGYGPCAEPIALGTAISKGERRFLTIVAVFGGRPDYPVMPPCGNCRQLLLDYAPDALVILPVNGRAVKVKVTDLIPAPYTNF